MFALWRSIIYALAAPGTDFGGGSVVEDPSKSDHCQTEPENYAAVRVNGPDYAAAKSAQHSSKHK